VEATSENAEPKGPSGAPDLSGRRFQFSLLDLLAAAGVCGLLCAMYAWGGNLMNRAPEFFLAVGLGLLAVGWMFRRKLLMVASVVVLIGILVGMVGFAEREQDRAGHSWRGCRLSVQVIDSSTQKAVPDALIRVVASVDGVDVQAHSRRTDATGRLQLWSCFLGYRGYSKIQYPGFVDVVRLDGGRMEVSAEGYAPREIALDEYFGQAHWDLLANGPLRPVVVELQAD
jgi:hypothetical protein